MSIPITEFKIVEDGKPSKSPDAIVPLPVLGTASELLLDCAATGGVGVISGPSGSGKSVAMRRLVTRYPSLGLPGDAFYYCCQSSNGPTRGIKALLGGIGVGGAVIANGNATPMQLILKIVVREFIRQNIRCLLLDETDRWDAEAIGGLFAMHDHLRDNDHPIALLMVTNHENPAWLADADPIRSRTLRVIRVSHVSVEEMLGLMAVWSDEFAEFSTQVEKGEKEAVDVARHIHDSTGGDLRRINFFARIFLRHFTGKTVTMKTAEATLKRLEQ